MAREGGDGRGQEDQMGVAGMVEAGGRWSGRRTRWQGWWGRRGGREPDGAGAVGVGRVKWQGREGMAGCRKARWQLLGYGGGGSRRVAGGRSSRWVQPVTRSGVRGSWRPDGGSKAQMGIGALGTRSWGWATGVGY